MPHKWERRLRKLEAPRTPSGECAECAARNPIVFNTPDAPQLRPGFRCGSCRKRPAEPFRLILGTDGSGV